MDEVIEVTSRNHKTEPVDVIIKETLYRWATNTIVQANTSYDRLDNRTVHFPVAADGETVVRYRVRYTW